MDRSVMDGIGVLAAIAAGADAPEVIASRLRLDDEAVSRHLNSLSDAGFVRRDGRRVILSERVTLLLDGLVGRSDLLAMAAPMVLEAEQRLRVDIAVEVVEEADPEALSGSSPFAIVTTASGGRSVVAPVHDAAGQVACVLRVVVDGMAPEAIEVLGKQLVSTADAISAALPKRKDRGPDWQLQV